ncbi:MAG: VanW family protein [Bacillota bacterium]|nr:VanW family protein [Bacillota bacterium]
MTRPAPRAEAQAKAPAAPEAGGQAKGAPPGDDESRRTGVAGGAPAGAGDPRVQALLEQYRLKVPMGTFRTHYGHASASQAGNIELTARRLNGQVVPPGQVFSMNGRLGPYDRAHGYGEGRMFLGDRIVPSIGGGVCQVASTLFNAVMLAGLPVVERHLHGLLVPYLPPGQDATVAEEAGLDFRFRNDRAYPVVIAADALPGRWLRVTIWGREAPPQLLWEHQVLGEKPAPVERVPAGSEPAGGEPLPDGSRLLAPGQPGLTVHSWVVRTGPQGRQRIDLGVHTYQPSPRIIQLPHGSRGRDGGGPGVGRPRAA